MLTFICISHVKLPENLDTGEKTVLYSQRCSVWTGTSVGAQQRRALQGRVLYGKLLVSSRGV